VLKEHDYGTSKYISTDQYENMIGVSGESSIIYKSIKVINEGMISNTIRDIVTELDISTHPLEQKLVRKEKAS
jgi:hypothetical protein